jgi:hypothetical protein
MKMSSLVDRMTYCDVFVESDFQHRPLLAVTLHICAASLVLILALVSSYNTESISNAWSFFPHVISSITSAAMAGLAYFSATRIFAIRNYCILCSSWIIIIYLSTLWHVSIQEFGVFKNHNSLGPQTVNPSFNGIDFTDARNSDLKNRCNHILANEGWSSNRCSNALLSGNMIRIYALIAIIPAVLRMEWKSAMFIAIFETSVLAISALSAGCFTSLLLSALLFQLGSGLLAVLICRNRGRFARQQFLIAQETDHIARQSRLLLQTLIPDDVLAKLEMHKSDDMLGMQIPACTILFCWLEPQPAMHTANSEEFFDFLNVVFSRFDDAVEQYGMFKYQHVVRDLKQCSNSHLSPFPPSKLRDFNEAPRQF